MLQEIELSGFKSFARKTPLSFASSITAVVGPNGSGKSNIAEAFRFVLGEQSMKSMRGKRGEDLIFNGSSGASRANRATVQVTFDNTKRLLDIDYDTVTVARTVHRDGVNQYAINGSTVRMRDVVSLLAAANIGPTGHHIISQGEADRILSAHPRERREMIEDALGLKVYQYKKNESEKKLAKTRENIAQVESLRREIAPHIRFLEKQVAKVKQAEALREDLVARYADYLAREAAYIHAETGRIKDERTPLHTESESLEKKRSEARAALDASSTRDEKSDALIAIETKQAAVRSEKDEKNRELGRLEGKIGFLEQQQRLAESNHARARVPLSDIETFADEIESDIARALSETDAAALHASLNRLKAKIASFVKTQHESAGTQQTESNAETESLAELQEQKSTLLADIQTLTKKDAELQDSYTQLRKTIEAEEADGRQAERALFEITTRQNEIAQKLASLDNRAHMLTREQEAFEQEITEGEVLIGSRVYTYKDHTIVDEQGNTVSPEHVATEPREVQNGRRKTIERIKIRLEEAGGGSGEEIKKEYEEAKERDDFLAHELSDLSQSADTLVTLIAELDEKLEHQFKSGLTQINTEFQKFFEILFGGGTAALTLVRMQPKVQNTSSELIDDVAEQEETDTTDAAGQEGIDVSISLPRKRIRGLQALSGGERSLVSIALIFAMSQVNPPPFIILDETDAALDESNARKYGEMIERLGSHSQLILITHNRETMRHADVLYGVTMGADAASRVLSVKFEDAAQSAAR